MAEEQGKKEESTEKVVALQTMYIKDISFEAPNSPDVFLETDISPETTRLSSLVNEAKEIVLKDIT